LQQAARNARMKAEALAQTLRLQFKGIRRVSERSATPRSFEASVAATAQLPRPIEAAALNFEASVTLDVAVSPR
jgi:uncharacterized protein YggE